MSSRTAPEVSAAFAQATKALRDVRLRPEIHLEEIPAPARIAPHSLALSGEVVQAGSDEALANGRFVVLYDPASPAAWEGPWRVVTFARAALEAELGAEPLLGEVGWSWLTDAIHDSGAGYRALGGTVTRVVSESFGGLSEREPDVELEIRASWSPSGPELGEHLQIWSELLCTVAGLPPLPEGVTALPSQRR
ncbi:MAG: DUF3000 domain-containing protein [Micrococcales bacterium]|nr:DUF3000 domain-containing protein [Micrococcales bacterium]